MSFKTLNPHWPRETESKVINLLPLSINQDLVKPFKSIWTSLIIIGFDSTDLWQGLMLACKTLPRFFYATNNISRLLTLMSNKKPGQSGQPDFVRFALAINVKWLLEYHENEFLLSFFCSTRINPISVIKCSGFRCHDPGITIFTNFFFLCLLLLISSKPDRPQTAITLTPFFYV